MRRSVNEGLSDLWTELRTELKQEVYLDLSFWTGLGPTIRVVDGASGEEWFYTTLSKLLDAEIKDCGDDIEMTESFENAHKDFQKLADRLGKVAKKLRKRADAWDRENA